MKHKSSKIILPYLKCFQILSKHLSHLNTLYIYLVFKVTVLPSIPRVQDFLLLCILKQVFLLQVILKNTSDFWFLNSIIYFTPINVMVWRIMTKLRRHYIWKMRITSERDTVWGLFYLFIASLPRILPFAVLPIAFEFIPWIYWPQWTVVSLKAAEKAWNFFPQRI